MHAVGWDDEAIYYAITVCALFNFYNRWIDASGVHALSDEAHRLGGLYGQPVPAMLESNTNEHAGGRRKTRVGGVLCERAGPERQSLDAKRVK